MQTSTIFLPDVNVWLALASRRHVHSDLAGEWFGSVGPNQAVFCRITQMGLLRLLTNQSVMGDDVVAPAQAWSVYRRMRGDLRVQYFAEPPGIEDIWHRLTHRLESGSRAWTDAYLQAFAAVKELQVVSFDRGLRRFGAPEAMILS